MGLSIATPFARALTAGSASGSVLLSLPFSFSFSFSSLDLEEFELSMFSVSSSSPLPDLDCDCGGGASFLMYPNAPLPPTTIPPPSPSCDFSIAILSSSVNGLMWTTPPGSTSTLPFLGFLDGICCGGSIRKVEEWNATLFNGFKPLKLGFKSTPSTVGIAGAGFGSAGRGSIVCSCNVEFASCVEVVEELNFLKKPGFFDK